MVDEIRRLTELLARDPSNIAFLQLAEQLRVRGELDSALKLATRGLERHSLNAEAHALLARIALDRGELQRAFDEWDMALRLAPRHVGALKGLGFIAYRWGRLDEAERYVAEALSLDPEDSGLAGALRSVRAARASRASLDETRAYTQPPRAAAAPERGVATDGDADVPNTSPAAGAFAYGGGDSPRDLFGSLTNAAGAQAILVDSNGLVVAGEFVSGDGQERSQDIAANLSGISDEADRAARHMQLGGWHSITFETQRAVVAMARAGGDALVVVASPANGPLGLLRRMLDRVRERADAWLSERQ